MANGSTNTWGVLSFVIGGLGGLLMIVLAHADQPTHPEAAREDVVNVMAIRLEGVSVEVEHSKTLIAEVKDDVAQLRAEQRQSTDQIIRAISALKEN